MKSKDDKPLCPQCRDGNHEDCLSVINVRCACWPCYLIRLKPKSVKEGTEDGMR